MGLWATIAADAAAESPLWRDALLTERDEESGADEPPEWSVQPDELASDEHA